MSGKIYKDKLDVFHGGLPDDIRIQKPEVSQLNSHFDIWSSPKKLIPYRDMEADEDTTFNIVMFLYANSKLYGLGVVVASGKAKVYEKSGDPITGSWTASSSGEDSGGARATVFFMHFHNYIYGGAGGNRLWYYGDITGSPSFNTTAYAVYPTAQGLVTTDDLLLVPCTNVVAKKNGAGSGPTNAWTSPFTLPSIYTISDMCEFGDNVAVLARPVSTTLGLNSKLFIWDKVSSDPSQVVDCGEGDAYLVDEIEGQLVIVSSVGGSSAFAIKAKMVVRHWAGGSKATQAFELESDNNTLSIYGNHCKFRDGNRLVFGLKITIDSVTYNQFFAIGRKTENYPLAYSFDRLVDNNTAISAMQGAFKAGNYVFIAHNSDGSVNRTNDQAVYSSSTGTHITQKLTGERQAGADAHRRRKNLVMAGLLCDPLTTGQSVSLYYRINAESSWTLIRTMAYTDSPSEIHFEAGVESDGVTDFKMMYEWQFKATEAGGARINAIVYAVNVADGDISSE